MIKVFAGEFKKIYDPSLGEEKAWYINDHTIIPGPDGWHLFGITHEEPADPVHEILCAHAISSDLLHESFRKLAPPFQAEVKAGELHFWAPHVILNQGIYYMFYCAGTLETHDRYRIHLATSTDLHHWTKYEGNPLIIDGYAARDPMVIRIGDEWVMYYACTSMPTGGNYCVACVHSRDLLHWGEKQIVFTSSSSGTAGGPCESPFVVHAEDRYFLFIGPAGGYAEGTDYSETIVYCSENPFDFSGQACVGRIPSHAAEVIQADGHYYVTHCGWGQGGVYLAPLYFEWEK